MKTKYCPECGKSLTNIDDINKKSYWVCSNESCSTNVMELKDKKGNENENEEKKLKIENIKDITEDSMLLEWIKYEKNQPHVTDKKKWVGIGEEVLSRKTLTLAAAIDLQKRNVTNALKLAATDVFVEKAQKLLTDRAKKFIIFGTISAVVAFLILIGSAYFIFERDVFTLMGSFKQMDNMVLSLIIFKATSASAFMLGAIYFLISLSRALLHEATVLFNRRHALRFGRLYVYLAEGKVELSELETAFKWNDEFTTAFKDIQADKISKTFWMKILEMPVDTLKSIIELRKTGKQKNKLKDNDESI